MGNPISEMEGKSVITSSSIGEAKAFRTAISKGKFFRSNILGRGFRRVASNYQP